MAGTRGAQLIQFLKVMARVLDGWLERLAGIAAWLALPVVAALFLQWPLRDLVRCCSREANDLGQWLFALYIAVAVMAASRASTHLAADALSRRYGEEVRERLRRLVAIAVTLPFALILAGISWKSAVDATLRLETFGDTGNPGYFIVKAAVPIMALLIGAQAFVEAVAPRGRGDRRP